MPNFHWIVVEDSAAKTRLVSDLLRSCGVAYTQLNVPTPEDWKIEEVSDKLLFLLMQGSAKIGAPGLVNFTTALAYYFCPS